MAPKRILPIPAGVVRRAGAMAAGLSFAIHSIAQQAPLASERIAEVGSNREIPPFFIKGTVSSTDTEKTDFAFRYIKGGWEVELRRLNAPNGGPTLENCRNVPDGVRHYVLFKQTSRGMTSATVCPNAFPPPGLAGGMFECWLSLCPYADLPLSIGQKMHRFLNIPGCEPKLTMDLKSLGDYQLSYLQPGGAFLSTLTLTNNGYYVDLSPKFEFEFLPFGRMHSGFVEFRFELLATTNVNGITFPLRTAVTRYGPGYSRTVEVQVSEVRLLNSGTDPDIGKSTPEELFAMDYRPSDYTTGSRARDNYSGGRVIFDQWSAVMPRNRTLRVFPTAADLGEQWSRQMGVLFEPIADSEDDVPRFEALPSSVIQEIQRSAVENWDGPVVSWGRGRFHLRGPNGGRHFEVHVQLFSSRRALNKRFAELFANVPAVEGQKRPLPMLGEEAIVWTSPDQQRMTLWFVQGEFLTWITPLGPGPHAVWDGNEPLQILANGMKARMEEIW